MLLGRATSAWANSRVIDGDLIDVVKREHRDVIITGSQSIVHALMADDLILAALAGTDLLRRRDGGWCWHRARGRDQAHPADLRALPPGHRPGQAAVTAAITFGVTIAPGFAALALVTVLGGLAIAAWAGQ